MNLVIENVKSAFVILARLFEALAAFIGLLVVWPIVWLITLGVILLLTCGIRLLNRRQMDHLSRAIDGPWCCMAAVFSAPPNGESH